MKKWFIYKDVLESIMEFSKTFYPNEFSGMLFSRNNIIEDLYIIPQTKSNYNSAVIRTDLIPMSLNVNGSVHSHPSINANPSRADLSFFQTKDINIIAHYPFYLNSFKAYDFSGKEVILEIILREKT